MLYIVGFDEAGYGPNLGPLVQAAVAVRVPDDACLWARLATTVRRATDPDDGRIVIDDSKLVYAGPRGLTRLEHTIASVWNRAEPIGQLLERIAGRETIEDLAAEHWYEPGEGLPLTITPAQWSPSAATLSAALREHGVSFSAIRSVITPARRFNTSLDRWDTKSAVLADGVIALLRGQLTALPGRESVHCVIDKLGGRSYYAAMIQSALPNGWVVPVRESAACSTYRVDRLDREITIVIRPRAEQEALPVALASMLAKYLREVLMRQFNRFWQRHVPELEPTAGYPADARRFYSAIRPAMERLGIPESAVWRRK